MRRVQKKLGSTHRVFGLGLIAVLALGACTERSERVLFDGNFYPTRERAVSDEDRNVFETTVRRADQGLDGALAAGMHGGTSHCIKTFGTSEINWISSLEPQNAQIANGSLVLRGRCVTW